MGSHRDIGVLPDDVDILVGRMRDDIDLGIADEKVRHDAAHRELHRRHARGAANDAGRFAQPMAYGGLGLFGLTQHRHCVAIELLARVGHPEPPRRAVEQPDPKVGLELLDAMAQRGFGHS
jgi:hypothetical protein